MDLMLMTLTTGIMVGGIYALVALGWVLIYKCSGVLNLAMGEMTLIGAYVSLSFYSMGVPFLLSLLFSLIIGFVLGILTERIFLDRLIGEPVLTVIMVTVGLSFFFKGTVEFIWGTDTRVFSPPVFSMEPVRLGPLIIGEVYLWSFVAAIILLIVFVCFFKYTRWGLAMQATADDEMAALSVGVSARFVYAAAWAIAFMAAGVGGTLLGNINGLNISVGYLGLLVLPVVVLGRAQLGAGRHSRRTHHRRAAKFLRRLPRPVLPGRREGGRPVRVHGDLPALQTLRDLGVGDG